LKCVAGVRQGDEVSVHYDPMIAKLVVWSSDRLSALRKLRTCLSEYNIVGLNTNVNFLMELASHKKFIEGDVHTSFIEQHYDELFPVEKVEDQFIFQAVLSSLLGEFSSTVREQKLTLDPHNPFLAYPSSRLSHDHSRRIKLTCQGSIFDVVVIYCSEGKFKVRVGNGPETEVRAILRAHDSVNEIELEINGNILKSRVVFSDGDVHLFTQGTSLFFSFEKPSFLTRNSQSQLSTGGATAPMPGIVEKIFVSDGKEVNAGEPLLVMIAMKMEYVIRAPQSGVVEKVFYKVGDNVAKNAPLVKFLSVKEDE